MLESYRMKTAVQAYQGKPNFTGYMARKPSVDEKVGKNGQITKRKEKGKTKKRLEKWMRLEYR
jgi:hypothetical protein